MAICVRIRTRTGKRGGGVGRNAEEGPSSRVVETFALALVLNRLSLSHKVAFQRADGAHSKDGIVRLWTRVRKGGRGGKKKPRRKRDEPELGLGATMESCL